MLVSQVDTIRGHVIREAQDTTWIVAEAIHSGHVWKSYAKSTAPLARLEPLQILSVNPISEPKSPFTAVFEMLFGVTVTVMLLTKIAIRHGDT